MKTYDLTPKPVTVPTTITETIKIEDVDNEVMRILLRRANPGAKVITRIRRV